MSRGPEPIAGIPSRIARALDWYSIRDRLLGSPQAQRWALKFPPTRWIARRRARQLFDLCAGFVYSQVLAACVEVSLFDCLAEGPLTGAAIAGRIQLGEDAARRLLDAACTLELVTRRRSGLYGLGPLGAALRGNPGVAAMIAHHRLFYADLADPVALLRGAARSRTLSDYWAYADETDPTSLGAAAVAPYTALMAASQAMVTAQILEAYPVQRHRHLLDIGGGDGSFLTAVGARAPDLQLSLFDLPRVADQARSRMARAGLTNRVTVTGGDFRADPLPRGADVATLVRVLHDHDDPVVLRLLSSVREALEPGGTLLVAEPMADTLGAETVGHAYFGFYLLAMGSGRPRSASELTRMLTQTGFRRVVRVGTHMPLVTSLLAAEA